MNFWSIEIAICWWYMVFHQLRYIFEKLLYFRIKRILEMNCHKFTRSFLLNISTVFIKEKYKVQLLLEDILHYMDKSILFYHLLYRLLFVAPWSSNNHLIPSENRTSLYQWIRNLYLIEDLVLIEFWDILDLL